MMNLQSVLEDVLKETTGSFGVAVQHLQTGEKASINPTQLYQMASSFKIPILATLLRDVDRGKLSLADQIEIGETDYVPGSGVLTQLSLGVKVTIKDLAMLMIIVSDNIATDRILRLVGVENVSAYMKELGLVNLHINQSCWELICVGLGIDVKSYTPEAAEQLRARKFTSDSFDKSSLVFQVDQRSNASTPEDMNHLLEMIFNKEILTEDLCDTMLDILSKQQFNGRIPYLLPNGTKVAHKTGTIGDVINDVGIVYLPKDLGAFTMTIFSSDNSSMEEGERTIARLTKSAYDYFLFTAKV
ncbi:serine hydrolase [Psychrobacillus sp.]|uniref:serine hydrolase n=1 Tax=Psychrobacillus sp. TaxID=1871623 RepID=UPI0028BE16B4|nr:serine hydrolase [Psychrobacillus sp.]